MKKFLFLVGLLICTQAHATIVALDTISADSTISVFNSNFTKLANANNGNIQGSGTTGSSTNILADSLGELDMSDEINPRIRANELLGIGVDTTTSQNALVYTGLVPATSVSLTSNISAGTAYINGYRVTKTAIPQTYTASRDTYVDLSQTGAYTLSPVLNGAAAPAVAANSVRLAKVVTSGTAITSVTTLYSTRIPGLVIPRNYRDGFYVSRDTNSTITVYPGNLEVNNSIIQNTAVTTLTLGTAGDWAGGSSLQAVSTYGYVGVDASGNIKLHTTAPAYSDYAVSNTNGFKRYNTWSSTVYRVIGWFYMNATGSGQLNTYEVGNIREGNVSNAVTSMGTTPITTNSTTYTAMTDMTLHFYSSGKPVNVNFTAPVANNGASGGSIFNTLSIDSVGVFQTKGFSDNTSQPHTNSLNTVQGLAQGPHTVAILWKVGSDTGNQSPTTDGERTLSAIEQ